MTIIPDSVREFLGAGLWAHVVTMKRNGRPHVNLCWAGFDGDEVVFASFFDAKRAARVRRDPHVTLSFHAKEYDGTALYPYLVIDGRATVTDGRVGCHGPPVPVVHRSGGHVSQPRDAARLDVPGVDRQVLWPGTVERTMGGDGSSPERPRSLVSFRGSSS